MEEMPYKKVMSTAKGLTMNRLSYHEGVPQDLKSSNIQCRTLPPDNCATPENPQAFLGKKLLEESPEVGIVGPIFKPQRLPRANLRIGILNLYVQLSGDL